MLYVLTIKMISYISDGSSLLIRPFGEKGRKTISKLMYYESAFVLLSSGDPLTFQS